MNIETSTQHPRAGLLKLIAAGLIATAATLAMQAQTAVPTPAPDQTTTPPPTTTAAPAKPSTDQTIVLSEFTVQASFAKSLEIAAMDKEAGSGITEVLEPEDIGKLPAISIADALTELTGLTSQRVNGRDQQITIRGFDPDFSVGTLDGVEQATTNDNRAVEYDQYPAELVGGVKVYKTGEADLVGGLAGTVDLETTSPLSVGKRVVALNAFFNWTQFKQLVPGGQKATGESYTISYIDQFANQTEGLYIGFSHNENPYEGENWSSWGFPSADSSGDLVLGGMRVFDQNELLKRDSVIGVLESKPNDSIHSKIDLFYSKFDDDQLLSGMQVPMAEWSGAQLQPGYTVTNGLVTQYTLTNVNPVLEELVTHWKDHIESAIWNLDLAQKSDWPVHFQTGFSQANRQEEVLETYAGLGFRNGETDPATFQVTENAGPTPPQLTSTIDFSNVSLFTITDPQGWAPGGPGFPAILGTTGQEGYVKYFTEKDIVDSFKLETTHNLDASILKDVQVGFSYTQRYKSSEQYPTGFLVNSNGQGQEALPPTFGATDLSGMVGDLKSITWNAQNLVGNGLTLVPNPNIGTYEGDDYKVSENIARPYLKFDLKGNAFGVPFEGNIGAVADLTTQSSKGESEGGVSNYVVPVSASDSYGDVLPSLNLVFKPDSHDDIRFFVGREEQRPRMYDMRASRDFGYNPALATSNTLSPWSGSSGNPDLKPWMSNSIDLDWEHYFGHGGGYVSVAVFDKHLLNYIYQQQTLTNFAGYPVTGGPPPVLTEGYTSTPVNGQGGDVKGLEGTLEITSDVLTAGTVKGFGIVTNVLLVESSIQPWGPNNASAPLPDLSKKSGNLTAYYENYGISARVGIHYQSDTREYIQNLGVPTPSNYETPNDGFSIETAYHTVDAQVSYAFQSGPLKGLTLYLEGRNLNNALLVQYNSGDPRQLGNWQKYGAQYSSGVTYKF